MAQQGTQEWFREAWQMIHALLETARIDEQTYSLRKRQIAAERVQLDERERELELQHSLVDAKRKRAAFLEKRIKLYERDDVRKLLSVRRRIGDRKPEDYEHEGR